MHLKIDSDNGIAIYEQIVRQMKYAIAEGTLTVGQLLPSVRDLAKLSAINPNTVQRAYMQLQADEVIEPLRGRGMVVASGAKRICTSDRKQLLSDRMSSVIDEALRGGVSPEHVRDMFDKALHQSTLKSKENVS